MPTKIATNLFYKQLIYGLFFILLSTVLLIYTYENNITPIPNELPKSMFIQPQKMWTENTLLTTSYTKIFTLQSGETLIKLFERMGIPAHSTWKLIKQIKYQTNINYLIPGLRFTTNLKGYGGQKEISHFSFNLSHIKIFSALYHPTTQQWITQIQTIKTIPQPIAIQGIIQQSLSAALQKKHVPASVQQQIIQLFAYRIDFQREIFKGNRFIVYYTSYNNVENKTPTGKYILNYAAIIVQNKEFQMYRFKNGKRAANYFTPSGESVRGMLMRTPINGAHITSNFGIRKHPILGYSRAHKGVDFGARWGTPIYASGTGIIIHRGYSKGYGYNIIIKHTNGYNTRYGHMSRFNPKVKLHNLVHQGDIIGYVGSTGLSTGPHLHYEVIYHRRSINPMSMKIPRAYHLNKKTYQLFLIHKNKVDNTIKKML